MLTLSALTMYLAQMLQLVNGLGTLEAGLWMLPFVAGPPSGSPSPRPSRDACRLPG
jgi:hypothetical protein